VPAGKPTFSQLSLQGTPATKAPPPKSKGTGLENKAAWALEVSLDVEHAHAVAPGANILLVTTPTAETLCVQEGFPQMMAAEDYVVLHHLASVISQSLAAAEESFGSTQSMLNLRHAFQDAAANGVTVLGSSGDRGTANPMKQPPKNPALIPFPSVEWPASDPLVTGVGGTYLCTDPNNPSMRVVDGGVPPATCESHPGVGEIGWIGAGGGFSHVFSKPSYQDTLPAVSTSIDSMRGVPDVAYQASSQTGVLTYMTLPGGGNGGLSCGATPRSTGWYDVGGTSSGSPRWAGQVAIAAQIHGAGLGPINPTLYAIGSSPAEYAKDFYDVTTGSNQAKPSIPGYSATTGWDPVTGLGTPNAANLVPDLTSH
jgi:subtilase family serine protease